MIISIPLKIAFSKKAAIPLDKSKICGIFYSGNDNITNMGELAE